MRQLVLGGARSGKSEFAESLAAASDGPVTYIATGPRPAADDPGWADRVEVHRRRRPSTWTTVETQDLPEAFQGAASTLLVEDLSLWTVAVMSSSDAWDALPGSDAWQTFEEHLSAALAAWESLDIAGIAVSVEVGLGVVPSTQMGVSFRDALGVVNRRFAASSDAVWFVVAGIPVQLK